MILETKQDKVSVFPGKGQAWVSKDLLNLRVFSGAQEEGFSRDLFLCSTDFLSYRSISLVLHAWT